MFSFKYREYLINNVPEHLKPDLYKCSRRYRGYLWYWFKYHKDCKKTKVIICFCGKEITGWGVVFKYSFERQIMLYVKKKYRRLGIGSNLIKKLSYKISKSRIKVYKDSENKKFFKSVKF